ncbi:MAG TPA: PilZ domain-containing protein [Nitrospira sp.]|nr:PilZ domain-containing protein [Nitrospira sp.]
MIPRYNERLSMRCPVVFAGEAYIGEGHVLNLTAPGCLVESPSPATGGDYVQLKMVLPGLTAPFYVELAAVRWTHGNQFGIEFIQMSKSDQVNLNLFLERHLPRILSRSYGRRRGSERGEWRRVSERWSQ